jgi:chromosome segregation ATPase
VETDLQWLKWIGSVVIAVLSLFGVSKVWQLSVTRRWNKSDSVDALHASNEARHIDANATAFTQVLKRLETVEARVSELQDKLSLEMQKSAGLEAKNEALTNENVRQAKRIHDLADAITQKDGQIAGLHREIDALRTELERMKTEFNKGNQL